MFIALTLICVGAIFSYKASVYSDPDSTDLDKSTTSMYTATVNAC